MTAPGKRHAPEDPLVVRVRNLLSARILKGETYEDLGKLAQIDAWTISRFMSGKQQTADTTLRKLEAILPDEYHRPEDAASPKLPNAGQRALIASRTRRRLRQFIADRHMSVKAFSTASGATPGPVTLLLQGGQPNWKNVQLIASYLGSVDAARMAGASYSNEAAISVEHLTDEPEQPVGMGGFAGSPEAAATVYGDPELDAMGTILTALEKLDPITAERVLAYVRSRTQGENYRKLAERATALAPIRQADGT